MSTRVLITGGAGFIGSHIADRLIEHGYEVVIYDNLEPQVHDGIPDYLNSNAEFVQGDVRNKEELHKVLKGVDIVSHQAAVVGVGQSMYEIQRYADVNMNGTATLLDIVVNEHDVKIEKMIVASSMSIYGEGEYYCPNCNVVKHPQLRSKEQMKTRDWELECPDCGEELQPKATPESKPLHCNSVYATSKKVQEEMMLMIGRTYKIPVVALRYFNTYGARQSLSNPYTGVCAIFSSRIKNGNAPLIFEDGKQTRDFIHVLDIAKANQLAIERREADMQVFNVGTGKVRSIEEIAQTLIGLYGKGGNIEPEVINTFREGDIRHCYADISNIKETLGFEPEISFEDGMKQLVNWAERQEAEDRFDQARSELREKGLIER